MDRDFFAYTLSAESDKGENFNIQKKIKCIYNGSIMFNKRE